MISHRLRALVAGLPIAVLSTVLVASPGFAAESLSISTPLAGSTVAGDLLIEGSIAGNDAVDITLGLAPQRLGDCGAALAEQRIDDAQAAFATMITTTAVPDGTYCLVAVADAGRLSTVVADITVDNAFSNGESVDGFQLPTESLGGDDSSVAAVVPSPSALPFGDLSALGPIALAATAALAAIVLALGLWVRRRSAS